jgi:hypothetical protein
MVIKLCDKRLFINPTKGTFAKRTKAD